ncbi:MAG: tripartite tricarboxylate transporter substrate binding protein [Magnetovibrio sp.]|nr:tripartite tricarboxylate transporter substrate binding protein [Magnetovibrio sp.]
MKFKTLIVSAVSVAALAGVTAPTPAHAAKFACSTAKLIVPWKAGGGTHVLFSIFEKTIAQMDVKPKLKVVTIPGQGGNKGAKEAAKAKPDGCTLFAIHQSAFTSHLNGRIKFHFDAFDPVALLTDTPDIIGASAKAPWDNYADFQKAVLAAPGTVPTGATFGSTSQFTWLQLQRKTGMKFKFVPFDGTRQRMTALLSGAITLGGLNVASGRKYIESGELKAYAIAADKRDPALPNLPTLKELGVDMSFSIKRGVVAPKGTPKAAIDYWAGVLKKAAADPGLMKQMVAKGTGIQWVGPAGYQKWIDTSFKEFKTIADEMGWGKSN